MAQTVNVRLSRSDNSPWGFRLQGGKDFGQPLLIQKVNGGSLAERAGLQVGDALIRVNNVDVSDMRHKDAQDTIVRAGHSFELQVQRGGGATWRPQVSPVGNVPLPGKASPATTVTKTSLAHTAKSPAPIGSGHNISPKPFGGVPQVNGDSAVKAIVNKQYNTPVQMYSEETIAETLSAQAEVLAGGAIGVNFMKNEKTYDSQKSEVFKMVQEVDKEPHEVTGSSFSAASRLIPHSTSPRPMTPTAKETGRDSPLPGVQDNPPCSGCGKHIVGVFVRIKDKNLHVECFKCSTCGSSLKNVGYYTINNKLYCDIHAKMVARQNPPAANLEPVTVPPGGRAPAGAFTAPHISAAPQSPQPGTLAPLPFHAPRTTTSHVVAPKFGGYRQTTAPSGPKPFGSVQAPSLPTSVPPPFTPSSVAPPSSAPYSSVPPAPAAPSSLSKPLSEPRTPVVWPPSTQTHLLRTEETQIGEKRLSICSEEVSSYASKKLEINSCIEEERPSSPIPDRPLSRQDVGKAVLEAGDRKRRSVSPKPPKSPRASSPRPMTPRPMTPRHFHVDNPDILDISTKPHGVYSLLPPACVVRPLSPTQVVVFPPEIPSVIYSRSPTPRKDKSKASERCTTCPSLLNNVVPNAGKEESHAVRTKETEACRRTEVCKKESQQTKAHLESQIVSYMTEVKREPSPQRIENKHEATSESLKVSHKKEVKRESSPQRIVNKQEATSESLKVCQKKEVKRESSPQRIEKKQEATSESLKVCHKKEVKRESSPHRIENNHEVTSESLKVCHKKEVKRESSPHRIEKKHESIREKTKDKMYFTKSEVEQLIHEEVLRALSLKEKKECTEEVKEEEVSVYDLPKPIAPSGWMTSALTTASERPFTPVPFPKPMELPSIAEKIIPMEPMKIKKDDKPVPLPSATTPYFPPPPPPPDKEALDERTARALREVGCRSPMAEALTIAPERGYSPLPTYSEVKIQESALKSQKKQMSLTSALTVAPKVPFTVPGKTPIPTVDETEKTQFKPLFNAKKMEKTGIDLSKIAKGGQMKETVKYIESGQMIKSHHEKSEKHLLPYYQENIGEIPVRNRSISPVPHPIVAPSIKPTPTYIPQPPKPKQETHISRKEAHLKSKSETSNRAEYYHTTTTPARPITPSGLHPPQELPYYQKDIGIIPIRNKSVSPVPHITKAPQLDTHSTMQQGYKSTTFSETKTYSAQKSSCKSLSTNVTKTKEYLVPERQASPSWKGEIKKTVQNLSPITVRLPSPRTVTPVQGETAQAAVAKVQIHRPRPSSPLPPKVKVQVEYPAVTSSGPTIGSEKSAFTAVKNGSNHTKKSVDQSSSEQKKSSSTSKCTEVCEKTPKVVVQQESDVCKKVCPAKDICQTTQSTHTNSSVSEKSVSSEQMLQKKHSGITSFRCYGATSNNTITGDEFGESEKHSKQVKMQQGVQSKAFQEQSKGVIKSETGQRTTQMSSKSAIEQKCVKEVSSVTQSVSEMKYGEKSSSTSIISKSILPGPKPFNGGSKGSFAPTTCPLPTFPSLPQLSDVPRTPGGVGGAGGRSGTLAGSSAPKRGRGILIPSVAPGARIPLCGHCNAQIRGPFITALGKIWCPEHFVCVNAKCRRPLQDIGFVEEQDGLYCEFCFEQYLAPTCDKCHSKIKGDCLNAIGKHFHPECFSCAYCGKLFGNNPFFLEDALPYCENDWNELFTTKCFSCGFPIEAGDRWVEALNNNYHSQCFNCTMCKKNLEGQSFFAKAGRPFCKNHAR